MPETFRDTEGRKWTLRLTAYTTRLMRSELDCDVSDHDSLKETLSSEDGVLNVIELLTREKRESRDMSEKEFWDAFDGSTIYDASEAFIREYQDFFAKRSPRAAALAKKGWEAIQEMDSVFSQKLDSLLSGTKLDDELKKKTQLANDKLDEEIAEIFGVKSTSLQDMSASTQQT